jgi:hypothetical protein
MDGAPFARRVDVGEVKTVFLLVDFAAEGVPP